MNNKKSTKRTLVTSLLSLVLCLSMLIGTTFAWFTDSVTSRNNVITAGNLDVVFEMGVLKDDAEKATEGAYAGFYEADDYDWVAIGNDTEIFSDEDLWEPGRVQTAVLRVSNAGTLALKYALSTNVYNETEGTNVFGETFKLSDYLDVAFVKGVVDVSSRQMANLYIDMADSLGAVAGDLNTISTEGTLLEQGDFMYYTMVVAMPETVGNEANYKTGTAAPTIKFGVDLYATQYTHEEDSYGNDYDANAKYNGFPEAIVTSITDTIEIEDYLNDGDMYELETAYSFKVSDEAAATVTDSPYKYWHADFVVTFDKDVKAGTAGLAGNYGEYGWIGFTTPYNVEANTPVRLLEAFGTLNYEELCTAVKEFKCGAFDVDDALKGTTMTVELVVYETTGDPLTTTGTKNEETGLYKVIESITYTFK